MDLESFSKTYFSGLNALSEKIAADIENTQEAYQDLWHTLSKSEQNQAIDESIINPSAVLKYANLPIQPPKQNYNSYSWFTKSQLNLYDKLDLMGYQNANTNVLCRSDADQVSKLTPTEKEPHELIEDNFPKSKPSNAKNLEEKPTKSQKNSVLKPKNPPPPPPPKVTPQTTENESNMEDHETRTDIPITGFDFLDNW